MPIHHDSILTLELPYRERLALRRTVFCGGHGPKAAVLADDHNVHYLNAETSGLFIPTVDHWISVHTGELLGRTVSPHHEGILSEVRSPVHGILFTLREYPLVYEGSLMARIMATNEAGDLIGHVFDGFDGQLRAEVKTPVSGLLSGIRRQPLLFEAT